MRIAIALALVCVAAVAFGNQTTSFDGPAGGSGVWEPWPDPDIEVKWVQTPVTYPNGNALASQYDIVFPWLAQVADDFECFETGLIVAVEWWGFYWNPGPPPPAGDFFVIEFWSDNGQPYPNSLPLDLLYQEPCHVFCENVEEHDLYHYFQYLDIPFEQEEGTVYWISIYAVFPFPPQYGWCTGEPPWMDCAAFYSPVFGYGEWTSSPIVWGECYEMAFALYGPLASNPVEESCWSSIKALYR